MINLVSPGTTFTADVIFLLPNKTPFIPSSAAQFNIRDFNGNLVLSGSGVQDQQVSGHWSAQCTLPDSVPVGSIDDNYTITWQIANTNQTMNWSQIFGVQYVNDFRYVDNNKIIIQGTTTSDTLSLPSSVCVDDNSMKVFIYNPNGAPVYTSDNENPSPFREPFIQYNTKIYPFTSTFIIGQPPNFHRDPHKFPPSAYPVHGQPMDMNDSWIVQWYWTVDGVAYNEFHFIQLVNMRMLNWMNDLKSLLDKARNYDVNTNLQFTDADLAHYMTMGLNRLNGTNPQVTYFSPHSFPPQFRTMLTYCAAIEALNAQLLAEGMVNSFEFSGQSVSLSVNRTAQLEAALDRFISYVDDTLPKQKALFAKTGSGRGLGAGVLGLSVGASTNRLRNAYNMLNRMRALAGTGSFGGFGAGFW